MKLRFLVLFLLMLLVSACVTTPSYIRGSINAAAYKEIRPKTVFVVAPRDDSLTERTIANRIVIAMTKAGYVPASKNQKPEIAVLYSYRVGGGTTSIYSSPNMVTNTTDVYSQTSYPRYFSLTIVNYKEALLKKKIIYWQGELRSNGYISDITRLAKPFATELVKYINKNATGAGFITLGMY